MPPPYPTYGSPEVTAFLVTTKPGVDEDEVEEEDDAGVEVVVGVVLRAAQGERNGSVPGDRSKEGRECVPTTDVNKLRRDRTGANDE